MIPGKFAYGELKALIEKLGGEEKLGHELTLEDFEMLRQLHASKATIEQIQMFVRVRAETHRKETLYAARGVLLDAAQTLDAFNVATNFALVEDEIVDARKRAADDYRDACHAWLKARKAVEG